MKKSTFVFISALCVLTASMTACGSSTAAQSSSESTSQQSSSSFETEDEITALYETYIRPLGLTTLIGSPWATPAEINPDDVLVTLEMKTFNDPEMEKKYTSEDNQYLLFPKADVHAYAADYFGMTGEQMEKAEDYDDASQTYVVMIGLGGAWDVEVTGGEKTDDLLKVRYQLINGSGEIDGTGVVNIKLNPDGTYQYLSNEKDQNPS